uniref:Uncharacterized protein n=1 Tax=viral metagenome TaxID=1070528 RepID=A0A6C0JTT0_9ZZZZ
MDTFRRVTRGAPEELSERVTRGAPELRSSLFAAGSGKYTCQIEYNDYLGFKNGFFEIVNVYTKYISCEPKDPLRFKAFFDIFDNIQTIFIHSEDVFLLNDVLKLIYKFEDKFINVKKVEALITKYDCETISIIKSLSPLLLNKFFALKCSLHFYKCIESYVSKIQNLNLEIIHNNYDEFFKILTKRINYLIVEFYNVIPQRIESDKIFILPKRLSIKFHCSTLNDVENIIKKVYKSIRSENIVTITFYLPNKTCLDEFVTMKNKYVFIDFQIEFVV